MGEDFAQFFILFVRIPKIGTPTIDTVDSGNVPIKCIEEALCILDLVETNVITLLNQGFSESILGLSCEIYVTQGLPNQHPIFLAGVDHFLHGKVVGRMVQPLG